MEAALTRLNRLRSMAPAEIAFRGRQEITKRLERIGVIGCPGPPPLSLREAGRAHFARFQQDGAAAFFPGACSDAARDVLLGRLPQEQQALVALAGAICDKRFDLMGYRRLSFGDPIDWHFDPVSGRRAPPAHWSQIDPLDPASVGDSKVIWELNRHQWMVTLAQAYRLTGDERYAEFLAAQVRDWMRANPRGKGINWTSSLELALRLISWCWALFLLRRSKALSPALFVDLLEGLHSHAAHVEQYLSRYFSPNTHLTGEALGLCYAGLVFPQFGEAAGRWHDLGRRALLEQLERQVLPDGVYFEQSTHYQRYTVEIYLHYLILARRHGLAVPPAVDAAVQRMLDCLLALCGPDGSMPQIGDGDGGALLPLAPRAPQDFRGVFAVAAAFFGRSDYAWAARGLAPEVPWLLGPEGCAAFDALQPAPPASPPSRAYVHGGYAVMRNSWERDSHQLILDAGPLGCHVSGGHGHADLLGVQCAVFGEPCIVDPGTYSYADARWRSYFRGTAAHSTVRVDGLNQADAAGPFKWQRRPAARLRRWVSTADFDLADADHDAYQRLDDPVTHRRRVFFAKPDYWVLVDDLHGAAHHRVELRFQFAAATDLSIDAAGRALARLPGGRGCQVLAFARAPLAANRVRGELHPPQGWVSPDYGRIEPAPALTYSTDGVLPLRLVTLLLPVDAAAAPPAVTVAPALDRIDLVFAGRQDTLHIQDQDLVLERQRVTPPCAASPAS